MAFLKRARAEKHFGIKLNSAARSLAARHPDLLAACFESLGDDCELGTVQRFAGAESESLFRFSALGHDGLAPLFADPPGMLSGLSEIRVFPHRQLREWWIGFPPLGFYYHSGRNFEEMEAAEVRRLELERLAVLVPRFLEELAGGDKIFVRFEPKCDADSIRAVFRALHRHHGHAMLWVDAAADPSQAGQVQLLEPGLARGFVLDRAPSAAPDPEGLAAWLSLLTEALRVLRPETAEALQRAAKREPLPALQAGAPIACDITLAVSDRDGEPPEPPGGEPVMRHRLRVRCHADDGAIFSIPISGMKAGALYTASAWVWMPEAFEGKVSLAFQGSPDIHAWPALSSHYGRWQRIVTSARSTFDLPPHRLGLVVEGPAGAEFFSTDWRLAAGVTPAA